MGTRFRIFSGHEALESIVKVGTHNARVLLKFVTGSDYTLEYHKAASTATPIF